ncbi:MAG: arginine--tRNA ligase, partial [Cytophagales bacterium]|nr:arginine--tRNA ligase [Cytophagales bacterium]
LPAHQGVLKGEYLKAKEVQLNVRKAVLSCLEKLKTWQAPLEEVQIKKDEVDQLEKHLIRIEKWLKQVKEKKENVKSQLDESTKRSVDILKSKEDRVWKCTRMIEELLKWRLYVVGESTAFLKKHPVVFRPTPEQYQGTHACVLYPYAKMFGQSPQGFAELMGETLKSLQLVSDYEVKGGYLNLNMPEVIAEAGLKFLKDPLPSFKSLMEVVFGEFSSPNTNKPLHLGHLRNIFLGEALSRLLEKRGYRVRRVSLVNDRGIHICKSMWAYEKFGGGETPQSAGMKGDHFVGKYYVLFEKEYKKDPKIIEEAQNMLRKWENGDEDIRSLWEKMNAWVYEGFERTYEELGIEFDKVYYESKTYKRGKEIVEEACEQGKAYKKEDGSYWYRPKTDPENQKLLLRGDKTTVYMTQDIATAEEKYKDAKKEFKDYKSYASIYVVGDEQNYHFQTLFQLMKDWKLPYAEKQEHLSYGMVDLPSGKMKSREGNVVDADDLIKTMKEIAHQKTLEKRNQDLSPQELKKLSHVLGLGALKYQLLRVNPKKRIRFDPESSISLEGNTATFVQYTHARICALRRKFEEKNFPHDLKGLKIPDPLSKEEQRLLRLLIELKEVWKESAEQRDPSALVNYTYEIARAYSRVYASCPILKEDVPEVRTFRYHLSCRTAEVIRENMRILGIEVPERM